MNQVNPERIFYLLLSLPALIAAFTIHEFAHAWTADRLGDDTPRRRGRLTLDPLAHLDPFGLLMIVIAMLSGLPLIGWAKPVPFERRNLANPRLDTIWIAIAGPISNILQAAVWFVLLVAFRVVAERSGAAFGTQDVLDIVNTRPSLNSVPVIIATLLATGVTLNIMLAAFNMLPIPPLDGHYVLEGIGPPFIESFFNFIRPFSFLLLFLLIQTPVLQSALQPFITFSTSMVLRAFGYDPTMFPLSPA